MPLQPPKPNATWDEIEAAITANKTERDAVEAAISAAEAAIAGANITIRQSQGELRRIDNNLRQWIEIIRDKPGDD
jgi:multidrug resistance efflux pump